MHGATLLHTAAYGGHEDAVKWLLSKGLDSKTRDLSGYLPEEMAEADGHDRVRDILRAARSGTPAEEPPPE